MLFRTFPNLTAVGGGATRHNASMQAFDDGDGRIRPASRYPGFL